MRDYQPDISVTAFLKAKNDFKYFQAWEASVIDWHRAEIGRYYYLCDLSHHAPDGKPIYSMSSFRMVKVLYNNALRGKVYKLMLSALYEDGRQEPITIGDDQVRYCYSVLWPATKAEVAKHKRIARQTIKGEIAKKLEAVDAF